MASILRVTFKKIRLLLLPVVMGSLAIGACHHLGIRIFINKSESLSGSIYIYRLNTLPQRGDLVIFKHAKFPVTLAKRVIGLNGDKVSFEKDTILVNDKPVSVLLRMNSKGRVLVPTEPQIVPQEQWLVLGDHPRSYDSRYSDFGLISTQDIMGKAWHVF